MPFDSDVVPGAAIVGTEAGAVNSDVHLFSSERPGDSIHHLTYVGDRESFYTLLDHAMPWKNRAMLSKGIAVFEVCFYGVVVLIESYIEKTTYCYGLRVMFFPFFLVRFPWWRQAANRFDHCFSKFGGEVAIHMVRNCWINPFMCTSHPVKNKDLSP